MGYHIPVLLKETIEHLKINRGCKYIDATLGDAGHTIEILKLGGVVLGIDANPEALKRAELRIQGLGLRANFTSTLGNFRKIDELALSHGFDSVGGVLFDLGFSSYELDEASSGLSFQKEEPLDMRLDTTLGVTAADLVNSLPERALAKLILDYSDERLAWKFAKSIVQHRSLKKFETTKELAQVLVEASSPGYEHGRIHPATRTFQALRIAVNDELANLEMALPRAARLLSPGGRLIVISFHSKEEKLAKEFGRGAQPAIEMLTKKPIEPTEVEIMHNIRARSAKMRVYAKA